MCGIAGFVATGELRSPDWMRAIGRSMADTMVHRGPDDEGVWLSPDGRCVLAHRRLSIIDTSSAGHQPMVAEDGASAIAFNGEFYSFQEMREELRGAGRSFRTRTDTEVFFQGYEHYDRGFFAKIDAMYAAAIYDTRDRRLSLMRDPFGKKPLYYARGEDWIAFASELHALACIPEIDDSLDRDVIAEYFALQYIDAPRTIYRGVQKLRPGHRLTWEPDWGVQVDRFFEWMPSAERSPRSDEELAEELEEILLRATERRMIADVPLGAFLSGGVDSATVCALMTRALGASVKTFSIGFAETEDSEHLLAREMAARLGTEHHDKVLAPDVLALADDVASVLDEPNADSSCLPTWLLSQFAREQVTVCLSGDGGDELFGGYGRYFVTVDEARRASHRGAQSLGRNYYSPRILVYDDPWIEELFGAMPEGYRARIQAMRDELDHRDWPVLNRLRKTDAEHYLPGAVLPKVDRMSMQHSLEVRSPLLGLEVARFAEQLGPDSLYGAQRGKLLLKRVTEKYVPREWLDRPKMGFGLPMQLWGRENILDVARERVLGNSASAMLRIFERQNLETFFERQSRDFTLYPIWAMLILEQWLQSHRAGWDAVRAARASHEASCAAAAAAPAASAGEDEAWEAHSRPDDPTLVLALRELSESAPPLVFCRSFPRWMRSFGQACRAVSKEALPPGYEGRHIAFDWEEAMSLEPVAEQLSGARVAVFVDGLSSVGNPKVVELHGMGVKYAIFRGRSAWERIDLDACLGDGGQAPEPEEQLPGEERFRLRRPMFSGYSSDGGHCYRATSRRLRRLFRQRGEHVWANCVVFEDGRMLPYPDRPHDEIRKRGRGRHSLWDDSVFFSTSDNSDPNHNGRRYEVSLLMHEAEAEDVVEAVADPVPEPPRRFGTEACAPHVARPRQRFLELAARETKPRLTSIERVQFFTGSLPPGGAERQLCYAACGLARRGIDVRVQTMYPTVGREGHYRSLLDAASIPVADSSSVHPGYAFDAPDDPDRRALLANLPPELSQQVWCAYTHIERAKPQVLHCFLDQPNIVGAIAGWIAGVPRIVVSARNTTPDHFPAIYQPYMKPWYEALAASPRVVFSGNTRSGCRDYERWIGLEEGRFHVVHNAVEPDVIEPASASAIHALQQDFELDDATPTVLGVFRLAPEKRPHVFLDMVERLLEKQPRLRVLIAGVGPLADELKARVRTGPLRDVVRMLGRRSDMAAFYGIAKVVCLCSEHEGMPNAILEAMLCERPVVASDVGGCPDLIADGETGFLHGVDQLDAFVDDVDRLLRDPQLRSAMGSAGRKRVLDCFPLERILRETLELYR